LRRGPTPSAYHASLTLGAVMSGDYPFSQRFCGSMRRMSNLMPVVAASVLAAGLTFTTPQGWKQTTSQSSMRVAEFTLPRASGDTEDAQLVIYYFGGQGGSVDANLQRWVGQIQQPDGRPSSAVAKKQTRSVNSLPITLLDVSGTYVAEMAPGSSNRLNKPGFRLRAGVVETANGPYFIKLTGPEKTIAHWDRAYEQFISSLRFQ
jgi:hypothetical protein